MYRLLWLMLLALGGADSLQTSALGWRLGGQGGSMRAPDELGEAPEGLLGGCKMLIFHCFFILFSRFPCMLRFGPYILSLVAFMVAPGMAHVRFTMVL